MPAKSPPGNHRQRRADQACGRWATSRRVHRCCVYLDEHLTGTRLRHRFGAIGQRLRWRPAGLDDDPRPSAAARLLWECWVSVGMVRILSLPFPLMGRSCAVTRPRRGTSNSLPSGSWRVVQRMLSSLTSRLPGRTEADQPLDPLPPGPRLVRSGVHPVLRRLALGDLGEQPARLGPAGVPQSDGGERLARAPDPVPGRAPVPRNSPSTAGVRAVEGPMRAVGSSCFLVSSCGEHAPAQPR